MKAQDDSSQAMTSTNIRCYTEHDGCYTLVLSQVGPSQPGTEEMITISDLPVEDDPTVAAAVHEAARGQVIYITERGNRVAGIVPAELASILEQLSADDLDGLAAAAEAAGLTAVAELMEDLADRAAVLESRADPGPGIPWEQLKAEAGL